MLRLCDEYMKSRVRMKISYYEKDIVAAYRMDSTRRLSIAVSAVPKIG